VKTPKIALIACAFVVCVTSLPQLYLKYIRGADYNGSNQNDFDISDNYRLRWSSDASRDITCMLSINDVFSGRQADREIHLVTNVGLNDIVLKT
jgi:hypothetical protein